MSNIYGKVLAVKANSAGHVYARVEDGNGTNEVFIVNLGNGHGVINGSNVSTKIEEGDTVKAVCNFANKIHTVSEAPNVYKRVTKQKKSPKDVGISVGHAQNGAFILLGGSDNYDEVIRMGCIISDVTDQSRAAYKVQNPKMDNYALGASVGCAVLNACRILNNIGTDGVADEDIAEGLVKYTKEILDNVTKGLTEYISS